ncbi:MAG: 50S ribosomal protein L10 [Thermoleophilia bacterium]|nr:50S ribosomal protein L10 [Thermoleophilia bacterium]
MNKDQKQAAVKEIGERLQESNAVFAVDYRGISVPQAAELRTRLREADASFNVVKNRLAKRIIGESGAGALDEHLTGPTALTYIKGDAVIAAKAIADFTKEHHKLAYKGGIMDGETLELEQFTVIARLPGVDVLHGQLVGLTAAPLTGLVRSLNGLIGGLATQLGKIAELGLVSGDAPAQEPAAEEPKAEKEAEEPAAEETEKSETATEDGPEAEADDSAEAGAEETAEAESEESGDDETDTKED